MERLLKLLENKQVSDLEVRILLRLSISPISGEVEDICNRFNLKPKMGKYMNIKLQTSIDKLLGDNYIILKDSKYYLNTESYLPNVIPVTVTEVSDNVCNTIQNGDVLVENMDITKGVEELGKEEVEEYLSKLNNYEVLSDYDTYVVKAWWVENYKHNYNGSQLIDYIKGSRLDLLGLWVNENKLLIDNTTPSIQENTEVVEYNDNIDEFKVLTPKERAQRKAEMQDRKLEKFKKGLENKPKVEVEHKDSDFIRVTKANFEDAVRSVHKVLNDFNKEEKIFLLDEYEVKCYGEFSVGFLQDNNIDNNVYKDIVLKLAHLFRYEKFASVLNNIIPRDIKVNVYIKVLEGLNNPKIISNNLKNIPLEITKWNNSLEGFISKMSKEQLSKVRWIKLENKFLPQSSKEIIKKYL